MKKSCIALLILSLFACSNKSASDYMISAKDHIAKEDLKAAIIDLKNALQDTPKLAEARYLLGVIYLKNYQYDNAEKELERALKYGYAKNEVTILLAKTYQKKQADNALLDLVLKDIALTPEQTAEINFYQLQASERLGKKEKVQQLIASVSDLNANSPFKSLVQVIALLLKNNHTEALNLLDKVLTKTPLQPDALTLKANLLFQEGKVSDGLALYRMYYEAYPDDIENAFIFANLLSENQESKEAEPIVDKLLKINDQNTILNQLKALARYADSDFANALAYSEKAIISDPKATSSRLVAGISAYLIEDFEKTQQHLSFIADQLPPSHVALRLLAASQLELGLNLDASKTISQFDQITEQDAALFSTAGIALIKSGDIQTAKSLLTRTPKSGQTPVDMVRLGVLRLSLNDVSGILNIENALKEVKTLNNPELNQNASEIKQVLATAYLSTGQFDKALLLAKQWQQEEPDNIKGFMLSAAVKIHQGDYSAAEQDYLAALKIAPENPDVIFAKIELISKIDPSAKGEEITKIELVELLQKQPNYTPALAKSYLLAKKSQQEAVVIKQLETLVQKAPENTKALITLGKVYLYEEQTAKAIPLFEKALQLDNTDIQHWAVLGLSYIKQADYEKAKAHYQAWLEKFPANAQAIIGNILAKESEGDAEGAVVLSQGFLDKQGYKNQEVLLLHTHLQLKLGKTKEAKQTYEHLSEFAKETAFAKGLLGQLQMANQQYQAALANLQIAYQDKASAQNADLIYQVYSTLNQGEKAYQFLTEHIQKQPQDQFNLMTLARLQINKDINLAINSYQKLISLNAQNAVAQNNIAYLYMLQNQLNLAEKHGKQALVLLPNNVDVLDTLGKVALLKNENTQALDYLTLAVNRIEKEKIKADEGIYLSYVEALLVNQQTRLAEKIIQNLVLLQPANQQKLDQLIKQYKL